MAPRYRRRRGRAIDELQRDLTSVARPNMLVLLWRWRYEVATLIGLPTVIALLITQYHWWWLLGLVGVGAGTVSAWPEARLWLCAHVRCTITAHRVRAGCAQAWVQTRKGKLPFILLTTPKPYGERVFIWCRAGICLEDFEAASDTLRSACWARDVQVASSVRYAHIVILDVIRYPLT